MTVPEPERLRNEHFIPTSSLRAVYNQLRDPFPVHWHEFYEIAFVVSGTGTHILNGAVYRLERGCLFLLTPADFHELVPEAPLPLELVNVMFNDELLSNDVQHLLFPTPREHVATLQGAAADTMEREFRRLWTEANEQPLGYQAVIHSTLQRILIDLARQSNVSSAVPTPHLPPNQPTIRTALRYIHHHFRSPLTLEEVAKQARLSPNYFSECFHQATGTPFQSYVQDLRLRFALAMLGASQVPVTELCYAAGFNTLSHFQKAFKRKWGQSPRAYRKSLAGVMRQRSLE